MLNEIQVGDRIRLIAMADDPYPISVGSLGTVAAILLHANWSQIDVEWDSGRTLMLSVPPDRIEVVSKPPLLE